MLYWVIVSMPGKAHFHIYYLFLGYDLHINRFLTFNKNFQLPKCIFNVVNNLIIFGHLSKH
jgi:hypothetical protein